MGNSHSSLFPLEAIPPAPHDPKPEQLLEAMSEELKLRGYGAKTRKAYLGHVARLVRFFDEEPQALGEVHIRGLCSICLRNGAHHTHT